MKALITGISGQDGSYLAEFLLNKNYQVVGVDITSPKEPVSGVDYVRGSISDLDFLSDTLIKHGPGEIYNLGSISQVSRSFESPEETFETNLLPVVRILELMRNKLKDTKLLQASSSEMFGEKTDPPFSESSLLDPLSPYALSKEAAYQMVRIYRKAFGLFACNAILFNHTSPRHSPNFIISKVIKGLVEIKLGKREKLSLGNLEIERDWGFAGDYVKAMAAIISQQKPDDFVVGTGRPTSLEIIVKHVLNKLDLSYNKVIEIDQKLFRPNDPRTIYSDPSKIKRVCGWQPEKTLNDVLDMMIDSEMARQKG